MKKLFLICSLFLFGAAVYAQDAPQKEVSKEKKNEMKKLKEANLTTSFTEAGLSAEQIEQARTAIELAGKKSKELKDDKTLTDDQKELKKKEINEEKNTKLKEVLGDKYKTWNEIRKKQKAQEEEAANKPS
jgi:methionine-rich copper-binding protein CopC